MRISMILLLLAFPSARASAEEIPHSSDDAETIVVTASRVPQVRSDIAANVTVLSAADLRYNPSHRLDDALRQIPGFSLLRQSSSVVSSNGIQGVSLRGTGTTSSSRTLVLLNGVPLNDPFGGAITWSRVPLGSIERIELVRGGSSGTWGNLGMGGVIQILTARPRNAALRLRTMAGGRETREVEAYASAPRGPLVFSAGGSYYDTDGYHLWREDQRGPIDGPASVQHETLHGRVDYEHSARTRLHVEANYADEDRRKGTPLGSGGLTTRFFGGGGDYGSPGGNDWSFRVFGTSRSGRNFSTTVDADRETERPQSDEYRTPSTAIGATMQWSRAVTRTHRLVVGTDHQWIEGKSFELGGYSSSQSAFTEERRVEGRQRFSGLFVQDIVRPSDAWRIVLGARVDAISNYDASDRLLDATDGTTLSETPYADETTITLSPSVGVVRRLDSRVSVRASAYRSFRAPTISELYSSSSGRGGVIIVGNAALRPEYLVGAEAGTDLRFGNRVTAQVTGFWHVVRNSVTQRSIGNADEDVDTEIPPCGLVPAGGSCQQTDNVGRSRSIGAEAELAYRPSASLRFSGSYALIDAVLTESDDPSLVGNDIRHVPLHQFTARATFDRPEIAAVSAQGRYVGERFEDDRNTLQMDDLFVADLSVARRVSSSAEAFLSVENVFDQTFEVRKTSSGLVEVGSPRLVYGGLRLKL